MIKFPDKLRICGKTWRLVRCDESAFEDDTLGKTDYEHLQIAILERQPRALEQDTVCHELVHAIDKSLDLGLKEHQVEVLGCTLQQIFADNPQLARYLTS